MSQFGVAGSYFLFLCFAVWGSMFSGFRVWGTRIRVRGFQCFARGVRGIPGSGFSECGLSRFVVSGSGFSCSGFDVFGVYRSGFSVFSGLGFSGSGFSRFHIGVQGFALRFEVSEAS